MPTPRTATEGETDLFEQRAEPERSVGVTLRQDRGLLDEGLTRARWLIVPRGMPYMAQRKQAAFLQEAIVAVLERSPGGWIMWVGRTKMTESDGERVAIPHGASLGDLARVILKAMRRQRTPRRRGRRPTLPPT